MKLLPCVTLPALSYSCYFKKGCFLKGRMQHAALSHLRLQAENAAAHLELRQLPFTPHPSLRGFRNLQPQNRKAHPHSARKHRSLTPTHQGMGVLPQDRNGAQRVEVVTSECEKPPSDPTPVRGVPGSPNFLPQELPQETPGCVTAGAEPRKGSQQLRAALIHQLESLGLITVCLRHCSWKQRKQ